MSEQLRDEVARRLDQLGRYHPKLAEARVIFSQEKFRHGVEIVVLGKALRVTAKSQTDDQDRAFHMAYDKIRRQLTDHRRRSRLRRQREAKLASARRRAVR